MVLTFVTGNANKLREVKDILSAGTPLELNNRDLDLPELQGTTQEVARAKVKAAAQVIQGPCITEDTALCFEALQGLPGPYIKDFLKALGHDGLNKLLQGFPDKRATAVCTFGYCAGPDAEPILFEGRTQGEIVPARGNSSFGWDPIFFATEAGQTYGEMEASEKHKISHRYRALDKLREYLKEHPAQ